LTGCLGRPLGFRKVLGLGRVQKIRIPLFKQFADAAQVVAALRQCCYGDGCIASVLLWVLKQASEGVSDGVAEIDWPLASCKDAGTKGRRR
jgi:hypothetical protein